MDDATVEILLRVKESGAQTFAEASALATNLKEAIASLNRSTAEGVPVTEAMRRALAELTRGLIESDLSAKAQAEQIKDLRQAMVRYIEVVTAGMAPEDAYNAVLLARIAEMKENAAATRQATAAQAANTAVLIPAMPAFLGLAGVILGATLALSPFVSILAGALTIVTAFTVAGTAMAALFGGIGLGIGALGAGTLALGISGFGGTSATTGPFARLKADATSALDTLKKQAEPLTATILSWADKGIPAIEGLASSIRKWFGERIPDILDQFGRILRDLTPAMDEFGKFLGDLFDRNEPKIAPMAEQFIRFGLNLSEGLLATLERLSDWFESRLPTFGPIVNQIFGAIGSAIGGIASGVGELADWFATHWPAMLKGVSDAWNRGPGADFTKTIQEDLPQIKQAFIDIVNNSPNWIPPLEKVAAAVADIATALVQVSDVITKLVGWINQNAPWIWTVVFGGQNATGRPLGAPTPSTEPIFTHDVSSGKRGGAQQIVVNVNGAQSPQATGQAVVRQLRKVTQF